MEITGVSKFKAFVGVWDVEITDDGFILSTDGPGSIVVELGDGTELPIVTSGLTVIKVVGTTATVTQG